MKATAGPGRRVAVPPALRRALPGLLAVMILAALDQTIMAAALPAIAGDLGGLDQMSAIITGYLVAAAAAMPLGGKLGDAYGRKRVLQGALVVFLAGAALCPLARSVLALVGSAYIAAAVAGPLAGGAAVDLLSWHWIFYAYLPLGLAALLVVSLTLHLPAVPRGRKIDFRGAALLTLAIVAFVLLCSMGSYPGPAWLAPALAVLAGAGIAGWLLSSRRAADPIIPLVLFRERGFAIPVAISCLIGFTMFGAVSYLPAFLQVGMGMSATGSGGLLLVLMLAVLFSVVVSGLLITRTGRYKIFPIAGTLSAAGGMLVFAGVRPGSSLARIVLSVALIGLGIGLVMQVTGLVVQNTVPRTDLGAATSMVTFLRQIGAAVGVAVLGTLITLRFNAALPDAVAAGLSGRLDSVTPELLAQLPAAARAAVAVAFADAVPPLFGYTGAILAVAFVLTLFLPERRLRTTAYSEELPPEGTSDA
ncbi:MFS transporter [Arthrobacter sp. Marseille-P9274]|uniref:MFS transporter n=1 Tax=Arthrobacter sp. Marseille-P9274 TaxID=2866572 RepID=UPI0021C80958|nr:MFS transporter [Arthrobacter sp. Marseille-P9274]